MFCDVRWQSIWLVVQCLLFVVCYSVCIFLVFRLEMFQWWILFLVISFFIVLIVFCSGIFLCQCRRYILRQLVCSWCRLFLQVWCIVVLLVCQGQILEISIIWLCRLWIVWFIIFFVLLLVYIFVVLIIVSLWLMFVCSVVIFC